MNIEELETYLESQRRRLVDGGPLIESISKSLRQTARVKPTRRLYRAFRRMLWVCVKGGAASLAAQQTMIDAISVYATTANDRAVKAERLFLESLDVLNRLEAENKELKSKLEG